VLGKIPLAEKLDPGSIDTLNLPYDIVSLTHFGPYQFSKTGEATVYNKYAA